MGGWGVLQMSVEDREKRSMFAIFTSIVEMFL